MRLGGWFSNSPFLQPLTAVPLEKLIVWTWCCFKIIIIIIFLSCSFSHAVTEGLWHGCFQDDYLVIVLF